VIGCGYVNRPRLEMHRICVRSITRDGRLPARLIVFVLSAFIALNVMEHSTSDSSARPIMQSRQRRSNASNDMSSTNARSALPMCIERPGHGGSVALHWRLMALC
jgi:hypothetical protein